MAGVGPGRRWLTLATGLLECLCFAGVPFGWSALVSVLKKEGYFGSWCVVATGANATLVLGPFDNLTFTAPQCRAQDERFSLVFAVASNLCNALMLPSGFLFDRFGTAVARHVATFLFTTGTLMVAFSTPALSNLLFPALCLIGLGGVLFLMSNIQIGNLFSKHQTTITTLYNGAFDSSSALFLAIKLLHEVGISFRTSFLFLSACSVIHLLRTIFLLPRDHIPYPLPEDYTYGMTSGKLRTLITTHTTTNGQAGMMTEENNFKDKSVTQEKSFRECLMSRFFLTQLLWLSVMQLRQFSFVATFDPTLRRLAAGQPSLVNHYTNAFAAMQMCGLLCAPWNGLIMDRHKGQHRAAGKSEEEASLRAMVISLTVTVLQCVLFSVCAAIPNLRLQYLTFGVQVIHRSFLYSGYAAFTTVLFPLCHFGKLHGLGLCLSSVISLLLNSGLSLLNGAIGYVNICLTLLVLLAFIHPLVVLLHCQGLASQRAAGVEIHVQNKSQIKKRNTDTLYAI